MKIRALVFTIVLLLMVGTASASSFGSFSSQSQKTVDNRNAKFHISVFNLGSEPLDLKITSSDVEGARIAHPRKMTVGLSRVTKNPTGSGTWFLLGNGKYVETVRIPVELIIDRERQKDSFKFEVNIRATNSDTASSNTGTVQNIAQIRSYSFEVNTNAPKTGSESAQQSQQAQTTGVQQNTGFINSVANSFTNAFNGFTGSSGSTQTEDTGAKENKGVEAINDGDSSGSENQERQEETSFDRTTVSSQRKDSSSSSASSNSVTGNFMEAAGVNSMTVFLMLAAAFSSLYVMRVL